MYRYVWKWGVGMARGVRNPPHTVKGIPEKDGASTKSTADLINPGVIKIHPCWFVLHFAWFHTFPEVGVTHVSDTWRKISLCHLIRKRSFSLLHLRCSGVDGPTSLHREIPNLKWFGQHGTGWRTKNVVFAAEDHDERCQAEQDRW